MSGTWGDEPSEYMPTGNHLLSPSLSVIFERPDMTVKAYASEAWRLHGQDADPDVAILKEAKAEYAKLQ